MQKRKKQKVAGPATSQGAPDEKLAVWLKVMAEAHDRAKSGSNADLAKFSPVGMLPSEVSRSSSAPPADDQEYLERVRDELIDSLLDNGADFQPIVDALADAFKDTGKTFAGFPEFSTKEDAGLVQRVMALDAGRQLVVTAWLASYLAAAAVHFDPAARRAAWLGFVLGQRTASARQTLNRLRDIPSIVLGRSFDRSGKAAPGQSRCRGTSHCHESIRLWVEEFHNTNASFPRPAQLGAWLDQLPQSASGAERPYELFWRDDKVCCRRDRVHDNWSGLAKDTILKKVLPEAKRNLKSRAV